MNEFSKTEKIRIFRFYGLQKELESLNYLYFFIIGSVFTIPTLAEFTSVLSPDEILVILLKMKSEYILNSEYKLEDPLNICFSILAYTLFVFCYLYIFLVIFPKKNYISKEIKKYRLYRKDHFLENSFISGVITITFFLPLFYTIYLMYQSNYIDKVQNKEFFKVLYCDFENRIIINESVNTKIVQVNNLLYKCKKTWDINKDGYIYKTYLLNNSLDEKFLFKE